MAAMSNRALDTLAVVLATTVVVSERLLWPILLFALKSLERLIVVQPAKDPLPELRVEEKELEPILRQDSNQV